MQNFLHHFLAPPNSIFDVYPKKYRLQRKNFETKNLPREIFYLLQCLTISLGLRFSLQMWFKVVGWGWTHYQNFRFMASSLTEDKVGKFLEVTVGLFFRIIENDFIMFLI